MKTFIAICLLCLSMSGIAQTNYKDSMGLFRKKYVEQHEVVSAADKKYISFFPADERWRMKVRVERAKNGPWFSMATSGSVKKIFRVYGVIRFVVHDTAVQLNVTSPNN